MPHKNVSRIIMECCRKAGIEYCSIHLLDEDKKEDVLRLRDIYIQLKEIASDLQEIGERHNIEELDFLVEDIKKLDGIDHDIIRLATRIKEVEK